MFKNSTIKKRLIILSTIAISTIFIYAVSVFIYQYNIYKNSKNTIKVVELSVKLSNVLHEMQKERGASAGYLNSKGKEFGKILSKQIKNTDKKLIILKRYIQANNNTYKEYTKRHMDFSKLKQIRQKVKTLSISTKDEVGFYTNLNKETLDIIAHFSTVPKNTQVRNEMNSMLLFIEAKERAGIERAVLSGVFARNSFTPFLHNRFISVVSQQKVLLNLFQTTASSNILEFYKKISKNPSFKEVQRMRKTAMSKTENFNIDAKYWFNTITTKINLLKKTENFLDKKLLESSDKTAKDIMISMLLISLISLIILFFIAFISRGIVKSILLSIDRFKRVIRVVNTGDLSMVVDRRKQTRNEMDIITREMHILVCTIRDLMQRINTSVDKAAKGDFSKDLSDEGLHGDFATAIHMVQNGIRAIKEANERQKVITFSAKVRSVGDVGRGLTLIQEETENLIRDLDTILGSSEDTSQQSTKSLTVLEKISENMQELSEQMNDTNTSIHELNQMSGNITSVVDLIKDIAEQTNLLSLNAAIEAARAGEQGRGFAVVADEVRKLAERTQKATSEINVSINSIKQETNDIVSKSNSMIEVSKTVSKTVEAYKKIMHKLEKNSKKASTLTEDMKNQLFLIMVKIDHIIYKANIYNAIVAADKNANFTDSEHCRFGLWYHSEGREMFGKAPSYIKIDKPHQTVHNKALENMNFIKKDDKRVENENTIVLNFKEMEKASYELYTLLDALRDEIKKSVNNS